MSSPVTHRDVAPLDVAPLKERYSGGFRLPDSVEPKSASAHQ